MIRILLCLAFLSLSPAFQAVAWCLPPEQVPSSPIPPLEQPPKRGSNHSDLGVAQSPLQIGSLPVVVRVPAPSVAVPASRNRLSNVPLLPEPRELTPEPRELAGSYPFNPEVSNAEFFELWNSPEMLEARAAVIEFCKVSARTSPAEGQQFLHRLAKLSPTDLGLWLKKFQARRSSVSRGRQVAQLARRQLLEQAERREEVRQQSAQNISAMRRLAAENGQYLTNRQPGTHFIDQHYNIKTQYAATFDPFECVFDPSSPRGYARRVAAAMSLPGDLPRGDPNNFIRGEVGLDISEE